MPLFPGLQRVTVPISAPTGITLRPDTLPGDVALRWAILRAGNAEPSFSGALDNVLMLDVASTANGSSVETRLRRVDTRPPARQADRVVLDIYRSGGSGEADHFGYWSFALAGDESRLVLPLAGGPASASGATPLPAASRRGPANNGRFTAGLTFYHGDTVLDTVTDIYTFAARPGPGDTLIISDVRVREFPLLFY
jgi:hypothetical protein